MTPVFNEAIGLWTHPGSSGFTAAVVDAEMRHCDYYHHRTLLNPSPVIVDIGGHVGIFSREMAKRYPAGRVFCIEPVPENAELAELNLAGLTNVTLLRAAVTYEENVVLHRFKDGCNSGGSQLLPEGSATFDNATEFGATMRVQCIWLDVMMQFYGVPKIDLLKLDCEGSEYSILSKCPCLGAVGEIVGEWHRVPGVPQFDDFCAKTLPDWKLQTFGSLTGMIGMFRLSGFLRSAP